MRTPFILYAPNVHVGGGLVLLKALLASLPDHFDAHLLLDRRSQQQLDIPPNCRVDWFEPRLASRWAAEKALQAASRPTTLTLCFHGLPPLLSIAGQVLVFQQNQNLFDVVPLRTFPPRTALRIALERLIARRRRLAVDRYIVQTPSMRRALINWHEHHGGTPQVDVLPFINPLPALEQSAQGLPHWNFLYVADGVAHKNHQRLLEAWILLSKEGIRPSLALTLPPRDQKLITHIEACRQTHQLNVHNIGVMPHQEIFQLYGRADGLIFPSFSESYGLPLIEAGKCGLPIVASELDFVRDVCTPAETFDPYSAVSIARAVKRFLRCAEHPLTPMSPQDFWAQLPHGNGSTPSNQH